MRNRTQSNGQDCETAFLHHCICTPVRVTYEYILLAYDKPEDMIAKGVIKDTHMLANKLSRSPLLKTSSGKEPCSDGVDLP